MQAAECGVARCATEVTLLQKPLEARLDVLHAFGEWRVVHLPEGHVVAADDGGLGDPGPHQPGPCHIQLSDGHADSLRRSRAYRRARSNAPSAIPSACAAIPGLEWSSTRIASLNPSPSPPSRLAAGTSRSSKNSWAVGDPRIPSFFSSLPILKPGIVFSTMKAEMLRAGVSPSWSVRAKTTSVSATLPPVMKVLEPLIT